MSGMLKDFNKKDTLFILFETMDYFTVTLGVEDKGVKIPVVESFTKSEMEMEPYNVLVDIVTTPNHVYRIVQNQPQPGNENKNDNQRLEIFSLSAERFDSLEIEKYKEVILPNNFYSIIGLGEGAVFQGLGAVLIGNESILKVNDITFEMKELTELDDDDFIENTLELRGQDAILLAYSSGTIRFLTQ